MTDPYIHPEHQRVADAWADLPAATQERLIAAARQRHGTRPPLTFGDGLRGTGAFLNDVCAVLLVVIVGCLIVALVGYTLLLTLFWSLAHPWFTIVAAALLGVVCLAALVLRTQPGSIEP